MRASVGAVLGGQEAGREGAVELGNLGLGFTAPVGTRNKALGFTKPGVVMRPTSKPDSSELHSW